jgi:hypothetical protein
MAAKSTSRLIFKLKERVSSFDGINFLEALPQYSEVALEPVGSEIGA